MELRRPLSNAAAAAVVVTALAWLMPPAPASGGPAAASVGGSVAAAQTTGGFVDIDLTAHEAQDYCQGLGTNLATISSAETNDLVADLCADSSDVLCYTGLNDEAQEGVLA